MASARSRTRSRFSKTEGVAVSRIPAWSAMPAFPTLTPGVAASYVLPVSAQGDVITVTWGGPTSKPAWISFSPPNALPIIYFSGGQTNTVAGVTLIATANGSSIPSVAADISVVVVNPAPSWSAAPSFSGLTQGVTSVQALPVTVSNGAVITPTWVGPGTISPTVGATYPWISLQGGTAPTITFTNPPVATVSNVVISALANGQSTSSATVGVGSVTVIAAAGNVAPVWSPFGTVTFVAGTANQTYALPVTDDGPLANLILTSVGTALPAYVSLDSDNRRLVYNGGGSANTTTTLHQIQADDQVADAITTFTLTSTGTQTAAPFMIGHAFAKGNVPSGQSIYLSETNARAVIKRRWNDGSAKHAILVGRTNLTANVAKTLTVYKGSDPGGTALTSASITAAAPSASVQCGSIGTVNLSSLLATPFRTFISTSEMVECHYRAQVGADTDLIAWFHVRLWAGGRMWVRAFVENGSLASSPATKSYTATVIVGGSTVYSGAVSQHAYSRWTATGWIGGDPAVTPKHNVAYLFSTKLVPNYWKRAPSSATLDGLLQTYAPMQLAPFAANVTSGGFGQYLGIIPGYEALYVTTGDARAYRHAIASATAFQLHGMIRRPTTNRLARLSDYPTTFWGGDTISVAGYTWDCAHGPNAGYVAYLVTGDYFHHETHGFSAQAAYFSRNSDSGSGTSRRFTSYQVRAVAWALNIIGSWCAVAPLEGADAADANVINDFRSLVANNYSYFAGQIDVAGMNQIGTVYQYSTGAWNGDGSVAAWMHDFWVGVNGFLSDAEPISDATNLTRLRDWMYRWIVGRIGATGAANYHFSRAAIYGVRVDPTATGGTDWFPNPSNFYDSWGDVWTLTHGTPNAETTNTLQGTSGADPGAAVTGYWGNLLPAIAYAVDHNAAGASASWSRLTGATNWSAVEGSGFDSIPIWGIVPRGYGGT